MWTGDVGQSQNRRLTVLVIEDAPDIAHLEKLWLEEQGHRVLVMNEDFEQALWPESWRDVDVVLLDLMMPEVDGYEIATYLRSQHPGVRIVIYSAKPVNGDRRLDGLADAVLQKPSTLRELLGAVEGTTDG